MSRTKRYIFGEWCDDRVPLTASDAAEICRLGDERRLEMARYPYDKIFSLLGRLSRFWTDQNQPLYREALAALPEETGFSSSMIEFALGELKNLFDPTILQRKVTTEFRGIPVGEGYAYNHASRTALHWEPLGTILHVLAGNVFLGGPGSFVEGLLTRNVNILKMSSGERVFLPLLVESLRACDDDGVISRCTAYIDYPSSATDVIAAFKRGVDGLVIWGGEEAVRTYRSDLPARTKAIIFGPKISIGVVTRQGVAELGLGAIAENAARDMAIWDQNACTAPQVCFVEGLDNARALVERLPAALQAEAKRLAPGAIDLNTGVEIRKIRTVFEVAEARGEGMLRESPAGLDWTVFLDSEVAIEPSPLHRTLRVVPFADLGLVVTAAQSVRGYLQSVGLVAGPAERWEVSRQLAAAGAVRIVDLGRMAGGEIDDPHDGAYDLPQLMHLGFTRLTPPRKDHAPVDALPPADRRRLIDERLRVLIERARRAPFYRDRLAGWRIDTVDDLPKVPILTRQDMEDNMPPRGTGMATGPCIGGYVTRSGGSTGEPKYSIYDGHDWEHLVEVPVRLFRAMGIEAGDRLANCMVAGDLYGSFVSFDHINCRVGVTTFAFASQPKADVFVDTWRKFAINVVQGAPGAVVPMLRLAREMEPSLTVEKLMFAGAPMSEADRTWLRQNLGTRRISSVIGANDGGAIAYQCEALSGALHHTIDDFNYIEIVDDDGRPVSDGESGRILITSLLKYCYPLIRYDIGDLGRIVAQPCSCGRTARTLEYLGRSDDVLCVGMLNLVYGDLRRALAGLPVSELQVAARGTDGTGELVIIRAECSQPSAELPEMIKRALLDSSPSLRERVGLRIIQVDVEVLRSGELARNPRTGKVKAIIDERLLTTGK